MAGTATSNKKDKASETEAKSDDIQDENKTPAKPGKRLDMENIEVKRMIAKAKKNSGLLAIDELRKHIDMDGISADDKEVVLAALSELGVSVYDDTEEPTIGSKTLARAETTTVKGGNSKEELDRTDDPVRMYLREMGVVELLSREGEIAIAKRIEAGREMMIGGICESPLAIESLIAWAFMLTT